MKDEDKIREQAVVEVTADGSHTLFLPQLNEHYHSVNGAVQEGVHVFIEAGLHQCAKEIINVFEVGFGTGLNALLTADYASKNNKTIHYASIEAFPLSDDITQQLNYAGQDQTNLFEKLHTVEWGSEQQISEYFYLTKIEADFTDFSFSDYTNRFDVIYFDAFAPDIQEYMWTQEVFDKMYNIAREDAILTTYCAKGVVRRRMQQAGFTVERIPGPPGKREMLRARKL